MGFLFNKKQFLKVIEWEDNSNDLMVYKFPVDDRYAIMNSSKLIVRPSQVALFVHKGQICDVFAPGSYSLATENIPIITRILNIPYGGDNPITVDIYFVNMKQLTGNKWGTQNPIMLRDAEFGMVRLRAFGVYAFKVSNPKRFMEQVFGTNQAFRKQDIIGQVNPMIIQGFTDAVAESKISALDLAANYKEFSKTIIDTSKPEFDDFGLELTSIVIENISLPKEVEAMLDKRSSMGIMEDKMGTYAQFEAVGAMRDAAKNPGNPAAGMGVGLGTGVAMGNLFGQTLSNIENQPKVKAPTNQEKAAEPQKGGKTCPKCGAEVSATAKFCPECGEKMPVAKFCANCGTKLADGAKFCPECGEKQ